MGGTLGTPREKNFLWSAIDAFAQGDVTVQELTAMLDETCEELVALRRDFDTLRQKQAPQVQEACRDIILAVHCDFDEYAFLLKKMKEHAGQSAREGLLSLREKEAAMASRLDRRLFEFRQVGLAALGPTKVPGINLLLATTRKIQEGHEKPGQLREQVNREKAMLSMLISAPPGREAEPPDPKLQELHDRHLQILGRYDSYFATGNADVLVELAKELTNVGLALGRVFMASNPRALAAEGPTSSPAANCLINAARGVRDGFLELPALTGYLTDLTRQYHAMKAYFSALSKNVPGSALSEEGMAIMEEDFVLFAEALDDYGALVEKAQFSTLAEAEDKLILAMENMKNTMDMFAEIARKENSVTCVRCSHENPLGERACGKCGALLPAPAGQQDQGTALAGEGCPKPGEREQHMMIGEHVQKLLVQARDFAEGKIGRDEFKGTLAHMQALLGEARRKAGQAPDISTEGLGVVERTQKEQAREFLEKVAALYVQGLNDFSEGLALMTRCAQGGDSQAMPEAMNMIWLGTVKLQQVQSATRPIEENI